MHGRLAVTLMFLAAPLTAQSTPQYQTGTDAAAYVPPPGTSPGAAGSRERDAGRGDAFHHRRGSPPAPLDRGVVLLDHKANPVPRDRWDQLAQEHGGQLPVYAEARIVLPVGAGAI